MLQCSGHGRSSMNGWHPSFKRRVQEIASERSPRAPSLTTKATATWRGLPADERQAGGLSALLPGRATSNFTMADLSLRELRVPLSSQLTSLLLLL